MEGGLWKLRRGHKFVSYASAVGPMHLCHSGHDHLLHETVNEECDAYLQVAHARNSIFSETETAAGDNTTAPEIVIQSALRSPISPTIRTESTHTN